MEAIWRFVSENQQALSWLGGGIVVVAGGIWTVAKFFLRFRREKPKPVSAVSGVAAGRDIHGSRITITHTTKSDGGSAA
jgi:hypothetical protein